MLVTATFQKEAPSNATTWVLLLSRLQGCVVRKNRKNCSYHWKVESSEKALNGGIFGANEKKASKQSTNDGAAIRKCCWVLAFRIIYPFLFEFRAELNQSV